MRFFAFIFFVLGLWALFASLSMGIEGLRAKKWPEAEGRIVISRVREWRSPGKIRIARLCLDLDYLYMVDGDILEGHRLDSGWRCFASEEHIKKVLEKYPSGKEVKVFYDPKDHRRCLLEPGLSWSVFFLAGIGLVNLSIAVPLLRSGFFTGRRRG